VTHLYSQRAGRRWRRRSPPAKSRRVGRAATHQCRRHVVADPRGFGAGGALMSPAISAPSPLGAGAPLVATRRPAQRRPSRSAGSDMARASRVRVVASPASPSACCRGTPIVRARTRIPCWCEQPDGHPPVRAFRSDAVSHAPKCGDASVPGQIHDQRPRTSAGQRSPGAAPDPPRDTRKVKPVVPAARIR
jgi:hypothetical protein